MVGEINPCSIEYWKKSNAARASTIPPAAAAPQRRSTAPTGFGTGRGWVWSGFLDVGDRRRGSRNGFIWGTKIEGSVAERGRGSGRRL